MATLQECPTCGKKVSATAIKCPRCGRFLQADTGSWWRLGFLDLIPGFRDTPAIVKIVLFIIIIAILVPLLIYLRSG